MSYREPEDTRWDPDKTYYSDPWDNPEYVAEYHEYLANLPHDDDEADYREPSYLDDF